MERKKGEEKKASENKVESPVNLDSVPAPVPDSHSLMGLEETREKQSKQIMWAVILMGSMILIIIAVPFLINNYFNKFDYNGLEFTKTKFGKLDVYLTNLPLFSSNSITGNSIVGEYALYMRTDPRDLKDINVDLDINNITFIKGKPVYVTYNPNDPPCQHNILSAAELGKFLLNFGDLDVEVGFMDENYAEKNKAPYVTCENNPKNTVIMVVAGKEDKISRTGNNCYELQYKDCDILEVNEKFIVSVAEGYANLVYDYDKNLTN